MIILFNKVDMCSRKVSSKSDKKTISRISLVFRNWY
jgi:hypothetical protein